MGLKQAAVFAGIGAFLGFIVTVLSYAPFEDYRFAYLIYGGALGGAFLGIKSTREFESSFVAFVLGVTMTATLGVVWGETGVTEDPWKVASAIVIVMMLFARPRGLVDVVLSPLDYVGGFAVSLLTLRFYSPIQGVDNGIAAIVVFSGSALTFVFLSSLARYGFETFRGLEKSNV